MLPLSGTAVHPWGTTHTTRWVHSGGMTLAEGTQLRSHFSGSTLVNLLESWLPVDVKASRQDIAERLGTGLSVADAVSLHAVLQAIGEPAATHQAVALPAGLQQKCDEVQVTLAASIASMPLPEAGLSSATPAFAVYRQRYLDMQHHMSARIDALRTDVRHSLMHASPGLAQLATLDGVLVQAWGSREQKILALIPVLLAQRFVQRCQPAPRAEGLATDTHADTCADTQVNTHTPSARFDGFVSDLRALLLAELALRMQPVWGLVDAFNSEIK